MAEFTKKEAAEFDRAYDKAFVNGDGLAVKCPFCTQESGCHPDECEYLIGYGDDRIEWESEFSVLDEISTVSKEGLWDKEHDRLFEGITFWESQSPEGLGEYINEIVAKEHPFIKVRRVYWEGMMISGNYGYAFIDHKHREKCLSDMGEVLWRLQEAVEAGRE